MTPCTRNPVPVASEMPLAVYETALQRALDDAAAAGLRGRAVTPFLLDRLRELTAGKSVFSNRALLLANARLAAGMCRVTDLQAAGVPVGLGVDGAASNEVGGLFAELRQALYTARLRTLDLNRPKQVVTTSQVAVANVVRAVVVLYLAAGPIHGLNAKLLAWLDAGHHRNIRMPTIVGQGVLLSWGSAQIHSDDSLGHVRLLVA